MAAVPISSRPVLFETRDHDRWGEYISGVYGSSIRLGSPKDGLLLRHTRLASTTFAIDDVQTVDMTYTVESLPTLTIGRHRAGTFDYRSEGAEHRFGPGEVFLLSKAEGGPPYWLRTPSGGLQGISVPFPVLGQVAATAETRHPEPLRFTDLRPGTRVAAQQLAATIDYLETSLRDRPEAMAEPLVAGAAGRMLAATVLNTFPNSALVDPTIEDRHDSHPVTLRRAMAFIDDHAHHDIGVTDIAAAAHVSIRALQYAFRRHRGTTPMDYLRQARLHHAHQELLATDPTTGVTVTEIAARWGFFHPGRFAAYYRTAYGCPPYRTLQRDGR
ncbi:helix-turn-helix domain-containing protein [Amycolatopsis sp. NPDC102389]|uniref:AraC family transcriptional regulator n=1 Tax=Amycolatopsis sp. NPDC102389 TaxID=3363941 RepID=UPI003819CF37